ncbi:MAG TPA: glycine rich domain-containing protein [Kofleriaceae bacterium]|nr:glycine rich domain-containing protein [Kofleriaceae bacterium]
MIVFITGLGETMRQWFLLSMVMVGACGDVVPIKPDAPPVPIDAAPDAPPDAPPAMVTLTVTKTGTGTITSDPAGITCGTTCTMTVNPGTAVTLTATPDLDTTFAWSGACTGNSTCQVTLTADTSVAAAFTCPTGSQTFNFTGAVQTLTRPRCVTSLVIDARGGAGGIAFGTAAAAGNSVLGGRTQATMPIVQADVITVYVGGKGANAGSNVPGAGGFNGGAIGSTSTGSTQAGGGGGGASDVRKGGTKLVVAGGAGGTASCGGTAYDGGLGGGLAGGSPTTGCGSPPSATATLATGGTQTAGGVGGFYSGYCTAANGTLGAGAAACNATGGGGGGGGYYGGGGGAWNSGGGGSSYTGPGVTAVTHTQGFQAGNGQVIISW